MGERGSPPELITTQELRSASSARFSSLPNWRRRSYDKFAEHEFRGRRWLWVDPLKDIKAAETAVKNGWKTNQQISEDYGGDYYDNIEEIKREEAAAKGTALERTKANEAQQG